MHQRNLSIRTLGRSVPWETIIPATFFAASAVCWYNPELSASIIFLIFGFTAVFFDSVAAYFTKPAAQGLSFALTDSMVTFCDEQNSEQTDRLLSALAESLGRAMQSSALTSTVKHSVLDTLKDEDLHAATIHTLESALIKASEDQGFRDTAMVVTKRAFAGALSDKDFVRELMTSIVGAIVSASQEEQLTKTMLDVITRAVSQAFADERFVSEIRGAVKDCLSDGEIYRAGARGVLTAAFGREGSGATKGGSNTHDSQHGGI